VLLLDVLKESGSNPLIDTFIALTKQGEESANGWKGYLIPPMDDEYVFMLENDNEPEKIKIDGWEKEWEQQEDPSNIWFTQPEKLKASNAYEFEFANPSIKIGMLEWRTPTSPKSKIPEAALLPDYSSKLIKNAYIKLQKITMLLISLNLSAEELLHFNNHKADFDEINFNKLTLKHWYRLEAFYRLRKSLPNNSLSVIEFFNWVKQSDDKSFLIEKIAELTNWEQENIKKLIAKDNLNIEKPEEFYNEKNLLKLQKAYIILEKINMPPHKLFEWAKPGIKFKESLKISEDIQKSIKARYEQEDWEKVVKPLNNRLRTNQRNALIKYLLSQKVLVEWGVVDENSLFEFFLIDVNMESCMETSRIKQAISSVQIFIDRCLLGEEEKRNGVKKNVLDRKRWEWMQRHRVWEANRKVFLYPENWIEPELRDDKSPFFKELESELLQKDINNETVSDALKTYLYKVDEVANMKVVGLYVEEETSKDKAETIQVKLHVFSRTRNAPYFFYYQYYDIQESNWYPWEKIQVDIPSYDVEDEEGKLTGNGCYLIPVVWNNRLLIFFPQFMKKTKPNPDLQNTSFHELGNDPVGIEKSKPLNYWEIKIAYSEYRNGKWTQKQISKTSMNYYYYKYWKTDGPWFFKYESFPKLNCFKFESKVGDKGIDIIAFYNVEMTIEQYELYQKVGTVPSISESFFFDGSQIILGVDERFYNDNFTNDFQYDSESRLFPSIKDSGSLYFDDTDYTINISENRLEFSHKFTKDLMGEVNSKKFTNFFNYFNNNLDNKEEAFGYFDSNEFEGFNELKMPYSIYNWELFFHKPALLADNLSKSQDFEEAMKWFHFIFNPYVEREEDKEIWRFFPFRETTDKNYLESLFKSLQPDQSNEKINRWREKPFMPHVIARDRPVAYMKWVVMKYLDNLIEWADSLYRQYTIETLNKATQIYTIALHILGPKPQFIPKQGKIESQTYLSLLDKWDAFGNAMVEMELIAPYSNQTALPIGMADRMEGYANIFGFASSLYFCIPHNPKLVKYWDNIEQRLYQIRHCQTIEGVFRIPALWDPPIDPAMLVRAAAQGLSISSVLHDLNSPMPNYRFSYLIQKAFELCNELKSLGNSMIAVMEKKDAEAISKMRASHETSIQNLLMEIKNKQIEEAEQALKNLEYSRKSPVCRLEHYLMLIGEELEKVPGADAEFAKLPNQIKKPKNVKGLKLSDYEKEELDKSKEAADKQFTIGRIESLASIFHAIPQFSTDIKPFGCGAGLSLGGSNLGNATQAIAKWMQTDASDLSFQSSNTQKKGSFQRQLQDRVFQANTAGYEIKNIDKQIASQKIRIEIANQEITNQQKQIDNTTEIEEFIKNKYTNEELYSWMLGSVKTMYYQVYKMAYELAKKAEKVYQFERGIDSSNFIQFGYWDVSRDGIYAGESLYIGLKQLETAYQEKRGHDYEISKHVSLRQVNPLALIELKETGKCEFTLPEVLFDMDYPGHYMRRIKSVALSIPCVVGPYTNVNCTGRLLENKYRISSIAKDKNDYKEKIEETADDRFRTVNIPITAIAASSGQNDSGVFELNFKDERFMPFEGAGVISKWRLKLPYSTESPDDFKFRQFDYASITDVVMHIRYTSHEGGDRLKIAAGNSLKEYISKTEELSRQEGLFSFFDLKHDFSSEWHKFSQIPQNGNQRKLTLSNLNELLPVFTKNRQADKIKATDVILLTESDIEAALPTLTRVQIDNSFKKGDKTGDLYSFILNDVDLQIDNWILKFNDTQTIIDKMWMVIRYVLK